MKKNKKKKQYKGDPSLYVADYVRKNDKIETLTFTDDIKTRMIELMNQKSYRPLTLKELIKYFMISDDARDKFTSLLDVMEKNGEIYKTEEKTYGIPYRMGIYIGQINIKMHGYGFLPIVGENDLFISQGNLSGAMNKDLVAVKKSPYKDEKNREEGRVLKVLKRYNTDIVGVYEKDGKTGFVMPKDNRINKDVFIPKGKNLGAKDGDVVMCKIIKFPKVRTPEGYITEVIGKDGEYKTDLDALLRQYGISDVFPKKVKKQAEKIPTVISDEEISKRTDFRTVLTYTIDGRDARDFDDAVSISLNESGNYILGVHIADVTHYVTEKSPLDKEALKRGTSVYLVDKVVPMLPIELSNGICSLNPDEDRLTLSCMMEIDKNGKILSHKIIESVIRSKKRLVYEDVTRMLENPEEWKEWGELGENLRLAEECAEVLHKRRVERGAIEFNFPESQIIVENEKVIDVGIRERGKANRIIEEFMLAANETVAKEYAVKELPFVYRVHESPSAEKMRTFNNIAAHFKVNHLLSNFEEVKPKDLQAILNEIKNSDEEDLISQMMLRSMRQARYYIQNLGHFGLAARYYTHFTSPIRRYPDLQIHRIIKYDIHKELTEEKIAQLKQIVQNSATVSSERERNADDAETDFENLRKAQYMEQFIGKTFTGKISSITNFGMFILLPNTIEGLVRLGDMMDDYYETDEDNFQMVGENTGKVYRIGMTVKVVLFYVNVQRREIGFIIQ